MKNRYDTYEYISNSYANGNISQCKREIKSLNRADRYDFIVYIQAELNYEEMADDVIKWCIKGEL